MAGINHEAVNDAGQTQANDTPVESRRSPASCFPAVHPLSQVGVFTFDKDRCAWFQQILFRRKELVVGELNGAPETLGSQINQFGKVHKKLGHNQSFASWSL